jgi:hypothetical protein
MPDKPQKTDSENPLAPIDAQLGTALPDLRKKASAMAYSAARVGLLLHKGREIHHLSATVALRRGEDGKLLQGDGFTHWATTTHGLCKRTVYNLLNAAANAVLSLHPDASPEEVHTYDLSILDEVEKRDLLAGRALAADLYKPPADPNQLPGEFKVWISEALAANKSKNPLQSVWKAALKLLKTWEENPKAANMLPGYEHSPPRSEKNNNLPCGWTLEAFEDCMPSGGQEPDPPAQLLFAGFHDQAAEIAEKLAAWAARKKNPLAGADTGQLRDTLAWLQQAAGALEKLINKGG